MVVVNVPAASELGIVVALGALLLRGLSSERRRLASRVVAAVFVPVRQLVHLLLR